MANIGMKPPSTQTVRCVRADMARSTSGVMKPAARLPAYRGRKVFTAWTSDERLSTFVATAEDRAPLRDDFKQLALLHEHDENLSGDAVSQPKVLLAVLVHASSLIFGHCWNLAETKLNILAELNCDIVIDAVRGA